MDIYGIGQALGTNADDNFCNSVSSAEIIKVIDILKEAISNADNNTRLDAGMFIDGLIDGLKSAYYMSQVHTKSRHTV